MSLLCDKHQISMVNLWVIPMKAKPPAKASCSVDVLV
jgi:hypothetical protein